MKACESAAFWQAYADGELLPPDREDALAHLAQCAACAAHLQSAEAAILTIESALADLPEAIPTARLRSRIQAALAEKTEAKNPLAWLWQWQWAAAAATLLAAWMVGWAWLGTHSIKPPQQARSDKPAPAVTPEPVGTPALAQYGKGAVSPMAPRFARRVEPSQRRVSPTETEVVTPFFPLREGEDLTALESAQLVRVELPGSALREVGLPVNLETVQTSVKADVVLGPDGLARAIRFVQEPSNP